VKQKHWRTLPTFDSRRAYCPETTPATWDARNGLHESFTTRNEMGLFSLICET
jgi:hypothetical protein